MTSRRMAFSTKCLALLSAFLLVTLFAPLESLAFKTPPDDACFVYPSPASGDTAWAVYNMPSPGTASVVIYNESGDMVSQVQELKPAGVHQTGLDLFYFHKGLYLCRITLNLNTGAKIRLKTFKFLVTR